MRACISSRRRRRCSCAVKRSGGWWWWSTEPNSPHTWDRPCVPMCILSTLSAPNSIENYYYHTEFRMDSMHIGTQTMSPQPLGLTGRVDRISCNICLMFLTFIKEWPSKDFVIKHGFRISDIFTFHCIPTSIKSPGSRIPPSNVSK